MFLTQTKKILPQIVKTILQQPVIRNYTPPPKNSSVSSVNFDREQFQAVLNVQQFEPEDLKVEVKDSMVVIEGKQEEQENNHRFVTRHFIKKYVLPKGYYDLNKVRSKLSEDGILTITAPKFDSGNDDCCKKVHIEYTGKQYLE